MSNRSRKSPDHSDGIRKRRHQPNDLAINVPAGKYKLSLTSGGKTETSTLEITPYAYNADAPIPPVSRAVRGWGGLLVLLRIPVAGP